jgi:hypothetical protein
LGALQQVAASTVRENALAAQVLGALGQSARIGGITGIAVDQTLPPLRQAPHFQATIWRIQGQGGQRGQVQGSIPSARRLISGSQKPRSVIMGSEKARQIISGAMSRGEADFISGSDEDTQTIAGSAEGSMP